MRKSVKQAPEDTAQNTGQFNSLTMLCTGNPGPQMKVEKSTAKEAEEKTEIESLTEDDKTRTACQ